MFEHLPSKLVDSLDMNAENAVLCTPPFEIPLQSSDTFNMIKFNKCVTRPKAMHIKAFFKKKKKTSLNEKQVTKLNLSRTNCFSTSNKLFKTFFKERNQKRNIFGCLYCEYL